MREERRARWNIPSPPLVIPTALFLCALSTFRTPTRSALRTYPKRACRHALPGAVDPNIARGACSLTGKPQCAETYARPMGTTLEQNQDLQDLRWEQNSG